MSREALKGLVAGVACESCATPFVIDNIRALGIEDELAFASANCAGCGAQQLLVFPETRLVAALEEQLRGGAVTAADLEQVRALLAEFGDSASGLIQRLAPA